MKYDIFYKSLGITSWQEASSSVEALCKETSYFYPGTVPVRVDGVHWDFMVICEDGPTEYYQLDLLDDLKMNADRHVIEDAYRAILAAASANKHITAAGLDDELATADIGGWLYLPEVQKCALWEWAAAMTKAVKTLQTLEDLRV
ncbi:MAG: hypothetical protein QX198_18115 [Methylococcaceae bacterium]